MKKFTAATRRLGHIWEEIETNFITIFTLVMGAIIMVDVVLRNSGAQGIAWVEEFGRFMLVVTTVMGCSIAVKSNGHMVMDSLYNALPPRWAYSVKAVAYAICSVLYLYMGYYSYMWMLKQEAMNKTMQSCQFPAWIMWAFVVYGITSMGLRYIVQTVKCVISAMKDARTFTEMNIKEN